MAEKPKNKYKEGKSPISYADFSWKAVEGWGIGATKNVEGHYNITKTGNSYILVAYLKTRIYNVPEMSTMSVAGNISLCVDGYIKQTLPLKHDDDFVAGTNEKNLGSAQFVLPEYGKVELYIDVDYIFATPAGVTTSANIVEAVKEVISKITSKLAGQATVKVYP